MNATLRGRLATVSVSVKRQMLTCKQSHRKVKTVGVRILDKLVPSERCPRLMPVELVGFKLQAKTTWLLKCLKEE